VYLLVHFALFHLLFFDELLAQFVQKVVWLLVLFLLLGFHFEVLVIAISVCLLSLVSDDFTLFLSEFVLNNLDVFFVTDLAFTSYILHFSRDIRKLFERFYEVDFGDKQETTFRVDFCSSISPIMSQVGDQQLDVSKIRALRVHVKRDVILPINHHALRDVVLNLHFPSQNEEQFLRMITLVVEHVFAECFERLQVGHEVPQKLRVLVLEEL
jgi:hypothetical protein